MATITARPRRWDKGSPLSAMRLNETVDALQDVVGQLDPLRKAADESSALRADEDDPTGANPAGIVWTFVSKETRTVRIEDATDDTICALYSKGDINQKLAGPPYFRSALSAF